MLSIPDKSVLKMLFLFFCMKRMRAAEHRRCVKNRQTERLAVAAHYWEKGHEISFEPKLLKKVTDGNRLRIWESIFMQKNRNNIFNTDLSGMDNILLKPLMNKNNDNLTTEDTIRCESKQNTDNQYALKMWAGLTKCVHDPPKLICAREFYNFFISIWSCLLHTPVIEGVPLDNFEVSKLLLILFENWTIFNFDGL